MSGDLHQNGTAQDEQPRPSSPSLRSRSTQRRRTAWIAAAVFLLGYPVVLIAVYRRFDGRGVSSSRSVSTVHTMEENRTVTTTGVVTTEQERAIASGIEQRGGRGGMSPWVIVQDALGSGTMKLAQVIREASNPLILCNTSKQLQRYESPSSAGREVPQLSTTTTDQHPLPQATNETESSTEISHRKELVHKYKQDFALGFSTSLDVDAQTLSLLRQFKDRVLTHIPNLHERAAKVNWGGTSVPWWLPTLPSGEAVDEFEGGRLLYYYFKVMHRYMTDPNNPLAHKINFPFRLCKKHGCAAEDAIAHTLEFREKYQPWRVTPGMREENRNGFCYTRGFSPSSEDHDGRHTMVWFRLGRHTVQDHYTYFRVMAHTLDRAIAEALHESNYRVGKFNVLIDGTDFDFHKVPSLSQFKHFVALSQDHHENRVGVLVLTNVSRTVEFVVSLVKPLLTKEVREKVHILSHDPVKRSAQLEALIQHEYIPDWLGGPDTYRFDVDDYYAVDEEHHWTNKESQAFIETMPYHAV